MSRESHWTVSTPLTLLILLSSFVLILALLIDKETINKWHISGSIKKAYDRSVKGYVYMTDINSKLQIPKDTRKQELYLIQPYLLLQVKVLDKK